MTPTLTFITHAATRPRAPLRSVYCQRIKNTPTASLPRNLPIRTKAINAKAPPDKPTQGHHPSANPHVAMQANTTGQRTPPTYPFLAYILVKEQNRKRQAPALAVAAFHPRIRTPIRRRPRKLSEPGGDSKQFLSSAAVRRDLSLPASAVNP
jgi:hypothetical protein